MACTISSCSYSHLIYLLIKVDSYEGEVGILEAALAKLRSHKWTSDDNNHDALIEALSMERGQQPLTPESRKELIQSILTQQKEQVSDREHKWMFNINLTD